MFGLPDDPPKFGVEVLVAFDKTPVSYETRIAKTS